MSSQFNPDLFLSLFGSAEALDDDLAVTHAKAEATQTEQHADDDFEAEVEAAATSVAAVIDNDQSEMAHKARLNVGQFGSAAATAFGVKAMDVRDADRADSAAHSFYPTLQRFRAEVPALYRVLMARKAWQRRETVEDRGPLGNDWNE